MSEQAATVEAMRTLIEQLLGEDFVPDTRVIRETRFVTDLGLVSLELIGLVFLCEQTFSVSLVSQPGLLATLDTVGAAVDAITRLQLKNCSAA